MPQVAAAPHAKVEAQGFVPKGLKHKPAQRAEAQTCPPLRLEEAWLTQAERLVLSLGISLRALAQLPVEDRGAALVEAGVVSALQRARVLTAVERCMMNF
jgi:hypothetical protein